jgi:ribonucleoside-diphosphate reductase alpha chain
MAFEWLTETSEQFLRSGYLLEGETPKQRIRDICDAAEKRLGVEGFSDKMYDYMSRGFYSLASPVWSNYGRKERGLPTSCFGSWCGDSIPDILFTMSEIGVMSKLGGGTSVSLSPLRPRGSKITNNGETSGAVHFTRLFEQATDVISQGSQRRGRVAPYLDAEHEDIMEFLDIATDGNMIQHVTTGVTVSDNFMESIKRGESETDKRNRKVWGKILKTRSQIGFPYIVFTGNANKSKPDVYQDKGCEIVASNLCAEIALPSTNEESFVCVLSSMNLAKYDEWKDTDAVETLVMFLDSVVTENLEKLEAMRDSGDKEKTVTFMFMERAYRFLKNHRALGLGTLGLHTALQQRMYPFASKEAKDFNKEVHKTISKRAYKASEELANMFGEPSVLKGYGRRNTTLMAIAPTKSSSEIAGGVSQGIEPIFSNYYIKDLAKVKVEMKNPALKEVFKKYGKDNFDTWNSVLEKDGSVQHLDFLTDEEKEVFLTISEIDVKNVLEQAADRQKYVDQSQSLNIMIDPDMSAKEINRLMFYAWENGIKSLYYQYNLNASKQLATGRKDECLSCQV